MRRERRLPVTAARQMLYMTATPHDIMVEAVHKHERSSGEAELKWSEFRSNDVFRRVELPGDVDVDRISASLNIGLLEITAPKSKSSAAESVRDLELSTTS